MDVARLINTTAVGNKTIPQERAGKSEAVLKNAKKPRTVPLPEPNKAEVQAVLDRMLRNTRFKYVLKDEIDYFVVKIIDNDTDKVIREIPSRELQRIHEGIERVLGILFDEEI